MIRIHDPKRWIEDAIRAMYQDNLAEFLISLLPDLPEKVDTTAEEFQRLQKKK